jgi:prolipoprotein diacylglyceryltransferase
MGRAVLSREGSQTVGDKIGPHRQFGVRALIAGLVGARLGYARYLNAYRESPLLVFSNPSTLSADTGILFGLLFAWFYGRRKSCPFCSPWISWRRDWRPYGLREIAHLLSGDAFGEASSVPWSIYLWNEYRHPAQVYEILGSLLILAVVMKRPLQSLGTGYNFLLLVVLSAGERLLLEAFRGDSLIWAGGLRAAQVISLIVLLSTLWLMRALFKRENQVQQ